jgi:hypothetical protein
VLPLRSLWSGFHIPNHIQSEFYQSLCYFILREPSKCSVFEHRVLRSVPGHEREKMIGLHKKLCNMEVQ